MIWRDGAAKSQKAYHHALDLKSPGSHRRVSGVGGATCIRVENVLESYGADALGGLCPESGAHPLYTQPQPLIFFLFVD